MAAFVEIDDIDRRILGALQQDSSRSIQEIADMVGLSSNPCWRRIRRLEDQGVIARRVALVDPSKLGLGVTAFVTIRTSRHDAEWLEQFSAGVRSVPEIVECHRMTGDVDYLLKVIVRDIEHYDRVYQRLIGQVSGLSDVSSTFSMERLKQDSAIDLSTL